MKDIRKLICIVVNYNYSDFVLEHLSEWLTLKDQVDRLLLVDDQSSKGLDELNKIRSAGIQVATTTGSKSSTNALNQLDAIYTALYELHPQDDDVIWVIDADDWPKPNAIDPGDIFQRCSGARTLLFYSREDVFNFGQKSEYSEIRVPRRSHVFWVSGVTTSSIMVRASLLKRMATQLRCRARIFTDVWYDIRLSSFARPANHQIVDQVICCRGIHAANDSMRYRDSRYKRYERISAAIAYHYYVALCGKRWNKNIGKRKLGAPPGERHK